MGNPQLVFHLVNEFSHYISGSRVYSQLNAAIYRRKVFGQQSGHRLYLKGVGSQLAGQLDVQQLVQPDLQGLHISLVQVLGIGVHIVIVQLLMVLDNELFGPVLYGTQIVTIVLPGVEKAECKRDALHAINN